jgi:lipopolysaccharide/colanic/teichoic acid biosynthesis glycosyltransferase
MLPVIDTRPSSEVKSVPLADLATETRPPRSRLYDRMKPLVDFSVALILFVLTLPLMVIAGLLIRLTSRGPAIYTQARLGRNGVPFSIYKLRTMSHNCEAVTGPRWCVKGDSRITPIGRLLRKMHIDELPQLWNVLRGEMSLVGPRPERPEIVQSLEGVLAGYRGRLAVKPGVTGLAQIQLPADTDIASVRDKLILDLCYVQQYGASLDIRLMFGTSLYLFGVTYAGVRRAMTLPTGRPEAVGQVLPLKG